MGDSSSRIILTGYLAPGTLGRALASTGGSGFLLFQGKEVRYRIEVCQIPIKMHFDIRENVALLTRLKALGREPIIVLHHGEEPKSLELAYALSKLFTTDRIVVPPVPSTLYLVGNDR